MKRREQPTPRPGESRSLVPMARRLRQEIPAFAGMAALLIALAGGAVVAQDRTPDATPGDAPQTDAAPAQPPPAGPPPMPKPVTMVDRPGATGGEALYVEFCAMCHAPNGMGHGLLERRVDVPDLEERDNLPAAYVILAARQGIGNMPPVPRGEVSDEEMQAIADYLAAGPHGDAQ